MNTQNEGAIARNAIETEIGISHATDTVQARLRERLESLTDSEAIRAHSFIIATQIEDVKISVEMLLRFLGVELEVEEATV